MKLTYFAQNLKLPGGDIEGPVKGPEGYNFLGYSDSNLNIWSNFISNTCLGWN